MDSADNFIDHGSLMPAVENDRRNAHRFSEKLPARLVLYLVTTSGFIISYMMRNDINIAILAMVKNPDQFTMRNASEQRCYVVSNLTNDADQTKNNGGTLEWSIEIQSYVLSSFFWVYPISQFVGGIITQKYGTKRVFGYAQLATAVTNLFIPWASEEHYSIVILLKVIQGVVCGFTWPAIFGMIPHWIPLSERSLFMTCFQGYNIGTGLSYVLGGFLIANLGWKSIFYTTGSMGLIWCLMWYLLVFDNPESHPRISLNEKQYLRKNAVTTLPNTQKRIPWGSILRSMPVWSNSIAGFGRVWVVFTFIIYGPQYMKDILGFDIETNGTLSGMSYLFCYLTSLMFSYIGDKLVSRNVVSLIKTRKLFTALSQIVPGLLCILIGYLACNTTAILIAWFVAVATVPAAYAGVMPNIVDIAPNFSGPVGGFSQTILLVASTISPLLAGYLIRDGNTLSAWRIIFNVAGGVGITTYFLFHIWGTAEIQSWDYEDDSVATYEMQPKAYNNKEEKEKVKQNIKSSR